jgi:hypothetical protein
VTGKHGQQSHMGKLQPALRKKREMDEDEKMRRVKLLN